MMKLTLNKIKEHRPCEQGWKKLLKSLNKTQADDEDLDLMYVLKSNGVEDAIWCLRCFDYLDYCLFLADMAESVLPIYEKHNNNKAPRAAIAAIREYKAGKITLNKLRQAAADAYAAGDDAANAAAYATDAAAYAAYAAAYATDAADIATDAAAYAAYAAAADAARKEKWAEITLLFIEHFGDVNSKRVKEKK